MVHFVGAGTGAEDLITVRGLNLIKNADVIIYAGSLVNKKLLDNAKEGCKLHDSAYMTLDEVMDVVKDAHAKNKDIVRLHTGEPSIYGAVREQMDILDKLKIPYDSCPGVTAAFGAAASLNMEYTLPGVTQSLIITRVSGKTEVPESESLDKLAAMHCSMAIYLSAGMLKKVQDELIKGGLSEDTPTAIVYKATWEDEKIVYCRLADLNIAGKDAGIDRLAVVLVGDAIAQNGYNRSKLYSPDFSTEYRKGTDQKKSNNSEQER